MTERILVEGDQFWVESIRGLRFTVIRRVYDKSRNVTLECVDNQRDPWTFVVGKSGFTAYEDGAKQSTTLDHDEVHLVTDDE